VVVELWKMYWPPALLLGNCNYAEAYLTPKRKCGTTSVWAGNFFSALTASWVNFRLTKSSELHCLTKDVQSSNCLGRCQISTFSKGKNKIHARNRQINDVHQILRILCPPVVDYHHSFSSLSEPIGYRTTDLDCDGRTHYRLSCSAYLNSSQRTRKSHSTSPYTSTLQRFLLFLYIFIAIAVVLAFDDLSVRSPER
jgi:hypothetical protein